MFGFKELLIKDIYKGTPPAAPTKVTLQITDLCNLRCEFCLQHSTLKKKYQGLGHVPFSWANDLIKELAEMGTKEICLIGKGEPSVHPDFPKIVETIKEHKILLDIYTNLSARSQSVISAYALADSLLINLSAVDEKSYKAIHGITTPKAFHQVLSNIASLKNGSISQHSPVLRISYIVTKNNFRYIEKAIELAESNGISSIQFKNMIAQSDTKKLLLDKKERIELVKMISKLLLREHKVGLNLKELRQELLSDQRTTNPFSHCFMGWFTLSIEQRGHLTLCCRNKLLYIGKWKKNSLRDIWTGTKAQRYRILARDCFDHKKLFGQQCDFCSYAAVNSYIEAVLKERLPRIKS